MIAWFGVDYKPLTMLCGTSHFFCQIQWRPLIFWKCILSFVLLSHMFDARLALNSKNYLRLVVNCWCWSPNSHYKYHWRPRVAWVSIIEFLIIRKFLSHSLAVSSRLGCQEIRGGWALSWSWHGGSSSGIDWRVRGDLSCVCSRARTYPPSLVNNAHPSCPKHVFYMPSVRL